MDKNVIEKYFADIIVLHTYNESGQKYVFLIEHPAYGKSILKVVKEINERFLREIAIAKQYNLSNIPMIYEFETIFIEDKEYSYIIEQYISGNSLTIEMKQAKFTLKRSLFLLESLLRIAVELENVKIVHRDIKPENIICSNENKFYLIDFGIARILDAKSLTLTENNIGPHTPGYGAPELFQYRKSDIDIRADLFSIGVVVNETIFNKHPFITGNEQSVYDIWLETATVVPQDFYIEGDKDRKLMSFLQTLMQKHISRRPPSAIKAFEWFNIIKESIELQ